MRIALITGSRADLGALEMVDAALKADHEIAWSNVEPMNGARNPNEAVEVVECASWSVRHRLLDWLADLVILHGDRHEILSAAMAANIMGVPIAHIGGGDLTEGSQDDCFRHAITKLSHLHFATCEESASRIIQMGEQTDRVHITGDPGIDRVMATQLLDRNATFAAVGLKSCERALLVCLHSNTLANQQTELTALSDALKNVAGQGIGMVLIGPNADAGSDLIRKQWNSIVAEMPQRAVYHESLPGQVYISLMRWCDVMVGNSSAGYYEAPCFPIRVVDIGDRQKGRYFYTAHERLWNIPSDKLDAELIGRVIDFQLKRCVIGNMTFLNPYGDGHAAERIVKIISKIKDPKALLRKRFYNCCWHVAGTPIG